MHCCVCVFHTKHIPSPVPAVYSTGEVPKSNLVIGDVVLRIAATGVLNGQFFMTLPHVGCRVLVHNSISSSSKISSIRERKT